MSNKSHRENPKNLSIQKYRLNNLHRQNVEAASIQKYKLNNLHRQSVKALSIRKCKENPVHKQHIIRAVKRQQNKKLTEQFEVVMQQFLDKGKDGRGFVCCVCNRLLFRRQIRCKREQYHSRKATSVTADQCINEDYLHTCNEQCLMPCPWMDSSRGQLWICYTCHYKINKG